MILTCAEEVCALLRLEREERGQSQREFADVIGCDQRNVSDYERLNKPMRMSTAIRMLRKLGYSVHVTRTEKASV